MELYILNEQEKVMFIKYVKYSAWYLEVLLSMFCGLKRGEIYALKFKDFNIEERTVTISRQVVAEYVKKENGKYTCIPVEKEVETESAKRILKVPSIIIEELEKRKIRNEGEKVLFGNDYKDNDLVSCQNNGGYRSLSSMNAALKRICKKADISTVTTQDLRDMYAERMLKSEQVSFSMLTALMGYGSVEETYERYSDLMLQKTE